MATISKPYTFSAGATIVAAEHNSNFDTVYNDYNGNITNANIAAAAAIANSKLNLAAISQAMALSGGLTMTSKQIDQAKGADVASAATTTIWITDGNFTHITGTTTITSFGTAAQAGAQRIVVFDGILTLTHNATSLILPTSANITTAAGDVAYVVAETTANARVIGYWRKDGTQLAAVTAANALTGSVVQTVTTTYATYASLGSATVPLDDSKPTWAEGNEVAGLSTAITPNSNSNYLLIDVEAYISGNITSNIVAFSIFQDATGTDEAKATAAYAFDYFRAAGPSTVRLRYKKTSPGTSAITFGFRIGGDAADTLVINGKSAATAGRVYGGALISSVTIQEIKG